MVEAMFFAKPLIAFDVIYNRETTENKASYFKSVDDLVKLLSGPQDAYKNGDDMLEIAQRRYTWETIARQYEALF